MLLLEQVRKYFSKRDAWKKFENLLWSMGGPNLRSLAREVINSRVIAERELIMSIAARLAQQVLETEAMEILHKGEKGSDVQVSHLRLLTKRVREQLAAQDLSNIRGLVEKIEGPVDFKALQKDESGNEPTTV